MPGDNILDVREQEHDVTRTEGIHSLLSDSSPHSNGLVHPGAAIPLPFRRQSSLTPQSTDGMSRSPRTVNRVRFDIEEERSGEHTTKVQDSSDEAEEWAENEDYLSRNAQINSRSSRGQRAPLLTGIEAPSVTLASAHVGFDAEDVLESARPKSGMSSAFMNMANSIM